MGRRHPIESICSNSSSYMYNSSSSCSSSSSRDAASSSFSSERSCCRPIVNRLLLPEVLNDILGRLFQVFGSNDNHSPSKALLWLRTRTISHERCKSDCTSVLFL